MATTPPPQPSDADAAERWWERAFGAEYLEVYAHRSDVLARAEVESLLPRLRNAPGPILDACCGNARHLAQLREAGLTAFGFDLSPHLLAAAAGRERCRGALARCDMRAPPFAQGWGAVLLLFTAFGYFDDDQNAACLRALGGLLAPGGWLLLDLPDPARLQSTLVPESRRMTAAGVELVERRRISGRRVIKDVEYRGAASPHASYRESVRLYAVAEISDMASACGLSLVETWPGLLGPRATDGRQVCWLKK